MATLQGIGDRISPRGQGTWPPIRGRGHGLPPKARGLPKGQGTGDTASPRCSPHPPSHLHGVFTPTTNPLPSPSPPSITQTPQPPPPPPKIPSAPPFPAPVGKEEPRLCRSCPLLGVHSRFGGSSAFHPCEQSWNPRMGGPRAGESCGAKQGGVGDTPTAPALQDRPGYEGSSASLSVSVVSPGFFGFLWALHAPGKCRGRGEKISLRVPRARPHLIPWCGFPFSSLFPAPRQRRVLPGWSRGAVGSGT